MIELALAGLLAFATVPAAPTTPMVEQVQFRGGPGGQCPRGYDYNHSNGRCYPNEYHAPGVYTRHPGPGYGGELCPRGYDYNYTNGRCYPNGAHAPGAYGAPEYYGRRGELCPPGFDYNYSRGQCFPNQAHAPGLYGR